jgi:hypothetical protein
MFVVAGSNCARGITGLYVICMPTRRLVVRASTGVNAELNFGLPATPIRVHGRHRASLTYQTAPSGVPRAAGARAPSVMIGGGAVLMKVVSLIMAPRFSGRSIRAAWYGSREMKAWQDGAVFPRNGETSGK